MRIAKTSGTSPKVVTPPKAEVEHLDNIRAAIIDNPPLRAGDRIDFAVTHELDVDGEKSWVKYGVSSQVGDGENAIEATTRIVNFVNGAVLSAATEVANQIMER